MKRVSLFFRRLLYLSRRRNTKAVKLLLVSIILVTLTLLGIQHASNYMEVDILPQSINYLNFLQNGFGGTNQAHYFDQDKLTEMMKYTMERVRSHSSTAVVDRTKNKGCQLGDVGANAVDKFSKVTKEQLLKCIDFPQETFEQLKDSHTTFLDTLTNDILDEYPTDLYGGKGIVIVGGGKYTLYAMPAIKAVRTNGDPTIPIELMIPPENDGEDAFCENVLPELDPSGLTRCIYMNQVFDEQTLKDVKGYQLKALALLASSFEKVLLLDADNYVVNSIRDIFELDVFKEFGLILWPDYWRRLHHPRLYDIVGISVNENKRVRYSMDDVSPTELYEEKDQSKIPFHDFEGAIPDGGTESGQLLVDKSKHLGTIILSLYYNYNGPSQYYPLLGQGFAGEGDKDTFALAATALTQRGIVSAYHQVKTPVGTSGYWANSKDETPFEKGLPDAQRSYRGVAMLQHDLLGDFEAYMNAIHDLSDSYDEDFKIYYHRRLGQRPLEEDNSESREKVANWEKKIREDFWKSHKVDYDLKSFLQHFKDVPVLFVHSHLPKYNPWLLSQFGDLKYDGKRVLEKHADDPNFKPSRHGHYRMYGDEFKEKINYDLELANFITMRDHICAVEDGYKNFSYLSKEVNQEDKGFEKYRAMCDYIAERVDMLSDTTWLGSVY
ncbi:hypothetical protein ZYGR_0U02010 [Zygosaccharomyces rouxii]|uniref:ZYRO0F13244p n=2 Tax=Zygosaccharomyces rouxii TaxID=4956 RepID=C5DYI2_ZYGRC|nr:uncharacterized protein ZYRO0F13244g [Zygosaccharomyces rouxii]KAH9199600.1 mannosyltransferase putative-domain-containing protein [Zygosaccharomyces rouxii]GAV50345.1 hypothetical protein ZYGR_0U02010 [Zygosaccharomyces rouxii]CAR28843.1 ZYRO0F13244p [Zygosaccharomyces rouxii]